MKFILELDIDRFPADLEVGKTIENRLGWVADQLHLFGDTLKKLTDTGIDLRVPGRSDPIGKTWIEGGRKEWLK